MVNIWAGKITWSTESGCVSLNWEQFSFTLRRLWNASIRGKGPALGLSSDLFQKNKCACLQFYPKSDTCGSKQHLTSDSVSKMASSWCCCQLFSSVCNETSTFECSLPVHIPSYVFSYFNYIKTPREDGSGKAQTSFFSSWGLWVGYGLPTLTSWYWLGCFLSASHG